MSDSKTTTKKRPDTEFKEVIVTYRDPNNETPIVKVGGNNVVINNKMTIKHYTMKVNEIVSLPVTFIEDLKNRSHVIKGQNGQPKKVPILSVDMV